MKQAIKKMPGVRPLLELAVAISNHMSPKYIANPTLALEDISPRPVSACSQPAPVTINDQVELSIIVPIYNVEKYVSDCIQSLINQKTTHSFEVILVNDGSSDASREIAVNAVNGDGRFRLIDKDNAGLASARNAGLDACRGSAVAFVDSDDFVKPDFVQTYLDRLWFSGADLISGGYSDVDENGRLISSCLSRDRMGTAWGRVYKREVWENVRFPEGYLFEDTVLPYLILPCFVSSTIKDSSYCYRHRKGSLSRSKNPRVLDTYWVVEYLLHQCERLGISKTLVVNEFLTNACFTVYGRRLQLDRRWLLPLFSAFSDLWLKQYGQLLKIELDDRFQSVAEVLTNQNFRKWQMLGLRDYLDGL